MELKSVYHWYHNGCEKRKNTSRKGKRATSKYDENMENETPT
jgi:hypothetical protein